MNNLERGEKIIEIFSEIKKRYGETHTLAPQKGAFGVDKFTETLLNAALGPGPGPCRTTGCIGSVLAAFLKGRGEDYRWGRAELKEELRLPVSLGGWMERTGCWHNEWPRFVFNNDDMAYNGDDTTTLKECCNYWIGFGERLIKKEQEQEVGE